MDRRMTCQRQMILGGEIDPCYSLLAAAECLHNGTGRVHCRPEIWVQSGDKPTIPEVLVFRPSAEESRTAGGQVFICETS